MDYGPWHRRESETTQQLNNKQRLEGKAREAGQTVVERSSISCCGGHKHRGRGPGPASTARPAQLAESTLADVRHVRRPGAAITSRIQATVDTDCTSVRWEITARFGAEEWCALTEVLKGSLW